MTDLEQSARERAEADFGLYGSTPLVRRFGAQTLVNIARIDKKPIEQWVVDVAEAPSGVVAHASHAHQPPAGTTFVSTAN